MSREGVQVANSVCLIYLRLMVVECCKSRGGKARKQRRKKERKKERTTEGKEFMKEKGKEKE